MQAWKPALHNSNEPASLRRPPACTNRCLTGIALAACSVRAVAFIAGCLPQGMPAYVDGGKSVATVGGGRLWICSVDGKESVKAYKLPNPEMQVRTLGDQIWGAHHLAGSASGLIWEKKRIHRRPGRNSASGGRDGDWAALPPKGRGRQALLYVTEQVGDPAAGLPCCIVARPVQSAQDRWLPRHWRRAKDGLVTETFDKQDLVAVDVLDAAGKSVAKLSTWAPRSTGSRATTARRGRGRDRYMEGYLGDYARLSPDKSLLLLEISGGEEVSFEVSSISRLAKVLWGGTAGDLLTGHPLVDRDQICGAA